MTAPVDVTTAEVDDAFYKSYGEGTVGGLDPALQGPGGVGRRPMTLAASDAPYRACWMEVRRLLREAKGVCAPPVGAPLGSPMMVCPAKVKLPDSPAYRPADWNDEGSGGPVQTSTNCYAYAMDSRTGHPPSTKPQPGQKSGTPLPYPFTCSGVTNAVLQDGKPDAIIQAPRCPYNKEQKLPPPQRPGYYLVALVITSKPKGYDPIDKVAYVNDYHWYRQGDDGSWSGKPGWDEATDMDASSKPITNPETADRRAAYGTVYEVSVKKNVPRFIDYDIFCGYFHVKKGGAPVGP